jgi:hypothetical protein
MTEVVYPEKHRYVALSHRWGRDEVTFADSADPAQAQRKAGFRKLERHARKRGKRGYLTLGMIPSVSTRVVVLS